MTLHSCFQNKNKNDCRFLFFRERNATSVRRLRCFFVQSGLNWGNLLCGILNRIQEEDFDKKAYVDLQLDSRMTVLLRVGKAAGGG